MKLLLKVEVQHVKYGSEVFLPEGGMYRVCSFETEGVKEIGLIGEDFKVGRIVNRDREVLIEVDVPIVGEWAKVSVEGWAE